MRPIFSGVDILIIGLLMMSSTTVKVIVYFFFVLGFLMITLASPVFFLQSLGYFFCRTLIVDPLSIWKIIGSFLIITLQNILFLSSLFTSSIAINSISESLSSYNIIPQLSDHNNAAIDLPSLGIYCQNCCISCILHMFIPCWAFFCLQCMSLYTIATFEYFHPVLFPFLLCFSFRLWLSAFLLLA